MTLSYHVCLSFAGEDRGYVEQVAEELRLRNMRVFYDRYEEAELWGKDLYQHLTDVYQHRAQYCVVFASSAYANKVWTRRELESAQARALHASQEYILLARFDDTPIPGILPTIGYVDLRKRTPASLADLIVTKVTLSAVKVKTDTAMAAASPIAQVRSSEVAVTNSQGRAAPKPAPWSMPLPQENSDAIRKFDMGALPSSATPYDARRRQAATGSSAQSPNSGQRQNNLNTTFGLILGVVVRRLRRRVILVGSACIVAVGSFLAVDGYTNATIENIVMASGIAVVASTIALPLRGFLHGEKGGG